MCSRDLLTRRRANVTQRRGGDVPHVFGCFIWDLQETSQRRANGSSWIRTTETSLGVSFEFLFETSWRRTDGTLLLRPETSLLRPHYDAPIRRRGDVPLRRLGDAPSRRCWVFHLRRTCDIAETYRETLLRRRHDVLMPGGYIVANTSQKLL